MHISKSTIVRSSAVVLLVIVSTAILISCGGGGGGGGVTTAGALPGGTTTIAPLPPVVLPSTCSSTPAGPITISINASRITGVAPLSVFFDASATTATATTRPFHDVEYRWDFGDPVSGNWGRGTRPGINSRNSATGPLANHVYETPGTYTVALTVVDGNPANTVTENCVQITVTNPNTVFAGANTVCVSGVSDFTGCPAGAANVTSTSFDGAITANIGPGKRILFRRGEIFFSTAAPFVNTPGPGIIGAFPAAGTKPIVRSAGAVTLLGFSSSTTPTTSDWRFMDLEIDGQSLPSVATAISVGVNGFGSATMMTFLRLDIHGVRFGFSIDPNVLNLQNTPTLVSPMWDQITIQDSTMQTIVGGAGNGGNGAFVSSARFAFQGNFIDDTLNAEHGLRTQYINKGVISNNTISNIASGRAVITLRTQPFAGTPTVPAGNFTEQIVVFDNHFIGGLAAGIGGSGPTNDMQDGRVRDQIWERNFWVAGPGTTQSMSYHGDELTFRNNLLNMGGGGTTGHLGIVIENGAPGLTPTNPDQIRIYNNTFFSNDTGSFVGVFLNNGSNITVQNNLGYAPNAGPPTGNVFFIRNVTATAVTAGATSNTSDVQATTVSPSFAVTPPTVVTDFNLTGGYGLNTGVAVPVFSDFFRVDRPIGVIDIGGTEQ